MLENPLGVPVGCIPAEQQGCSWRWFTVFYQYSIVYVKKLLQFCIFAIFSVAPKYAVTRRMNPMH